jgi:hypothetical protein
VAYVRVNDNAHGANEMHRYTLAGGKQPPKLAHAGEAGEAMRAARDEVREDDRSMAGVEDKRSVASELAAERFRLATELAVAGKSPYPDGAAFVASDMPDLGAIVARHARERRPVVLVYPDGEERVLAPGQLTERGAA